MHLLAEGLQHGAVDNFANLDLVLGRIEDSELRPDLLLLSGDLADRGEAAAYRRLRRRVELSSERLGAPALYLPGNHDDRPTFRAELLDETPSTAPIDQVTWCGGLRMVAMDSTIPGEEGGELEAEQLAWLCEALAEPAPEGSVLALHHPPVSSPIASMSRIALQHPEQLGEAIAGSDVRVILAGHNHHAMAGTLRGILVWLSPATSYRADPLAPEGSFRGYPGMACSRVDIEGDSVLASAVVVAGEEPIVELPVGSMPER